MPQTLQAPPSPSEIIRAALEPGLKGGIAANRTARVLDALRAAGWSFIRRDAISASEAVDAGELSGLTYDELLRRKILAECRIAEIRLAKIDVDAAQDDDLTCSVMAFCAEGLEPVGGHYLLIEDAYKAYREWCHIKGIGPFDLPWFHVRLAADRPIFGTARGPAIMGSSLRKLDIAGADVPDGAAMIRPVEVRAGAALAPKPADASRQDEADLTPEFIAALSVRAAAETTAIAAACRTASEAIAAVQKIAAGRPVGAPPAKPSRIERAAWVAEQLIPRILAEFPDAVPERDPDGMSAHHLLFMAQTLARREVNSETKACRWLGWLHPARRSRSTKDAQMWPFRSKIKPPTSYRLGVFLRSGNSFILRDVYRHKIESEDGVFSLFEVRQHADPRLPEEAMHVVDFNQIEAVLVLPE